MKKIIPLFIAIMLGMSLVPHFSQARGFSHSFSRHISTPSRSNTYHSGSYRSGYKSPSSKVNRTQGSNSRRGSMGRSIATHAAAFGAGMLLGHMFHPFGGFYGGGSFGFSSIGLLLDIVIILVIIWILKKIFTRRRY